MLTRYMLIAVEERMEGVPMSIVLLKPRDVLTDVLNSSAKIAECLLGGDHVELAILHNSTDGQIGEVLS